MYVLSGFGFLVVVFYKHLLIMQCAWVTLWIFLLTEWHSSTWVSSWLLWVFFFQNVFPKEENTQGEKTHTTLLPLANYSVTIKEGFRRKKAQMSPSCLTHLPFTHCFLPLTSPLFNFIILSQHWLGYRNNLESSPTPPLSKVHFVWNILAPPVSMGAGSSTKKVTACRHHHLFIETLKVRLIKSYLL